MAAFVLAVAATSFVGTTSPPAHFSLSGHSSGGSIASTHFFAFSDRIVGLGHIQAAPYGCARVLNESNSSAFNDLCHSRAAVERMAAIARRAARRGLIAPLDNLRKPVFVYAGAVDPIVYYTVGAAAADLYRELGADVAYHNHPNASHAFSTDGCAPCNPCDYLGPPFINDCGYDLAGKLLAHAYGPLAPRTAPSPHAIWQLDQSRFFPPHKTEAEVGMDSRAYAYVPPSCEGEKSAACKIHVAYHGCSSGVNSTHEGKRGLDIVRYAGYNGWAEANGIVVLYPQAYEDWCWNWDGNYVADGDRYDTRTSVQLVVVNAMVDAVAERLRDGDLRALRLGSLPTRSGPHYGPPPPRTYVSAAHSN